NISTLSLHDALPILNGMYIRELSDSELKARLMEFDQELSSLNEQLIESLLPLAKTRMKTLAEFRALVLPFIKKHTVELEPADASDRKSTRLNSSHVK